MSAGVSGLPPNIIFFLVDDVDVELSSMDYLPKTKKLLAEQGSSFSQMYASVPVCCPSRSSLYSGQYQHNHRAVNNSIDGNCAGQRWVNVTEPAAFPALLTGYQKTFAGKYLNK